MQKFVTTALQLIEDSLKGALIGAAIGIWVVGFTPDRTATSTTSDQIAAITSETNN
ncbi:MAG: hypothetical protein KUA43_13885 [Hoeflea sp.]|uniref:hypothetical protein n=1 Tax=Hoeflea sp. TaxID=1940281 RepID=UPI001E067013|nr:hypothetical protein [Hoeflea sp.]MBU4531249.1 hypothetical protein [Alphaproteobacteria bacterium]MBU4545688.1 hypothetical protein [Alphaproteobacteria bacterium]MBU4550657.1 hypothetical protein [Alphaproteobacteria bacterium]MBV1724526.1 hypothetical protein [Hoeflea sp.]MBV1760546.1 hypothetical protein [Hoeflea sp.]